MTDVGDNLCCPITFELYRDPVTAEDGFVYERGAIVQWINQNGTSPFTRQILHVDRLRPNERIRRLADQRRRLSVSYSNRNGGQVELPPLRNASPIRPVDATVFGGNLAVVNDQFRRCRRVQCPDIRENIREMWEGISGVCSACLSSDCVIWVCCIIICIGMFAGIICIHSFQKSMDNFMVQSDSMNNHFARIDMIFGQSLSLYWR
ncbi:unnamed protein product [Rotaria socialis]|uniref:U-box domain-containing protein n=1 Tax=Rotaria socialis TaxID=392032 RepID=A0A819A5T6_9BILA|nr:unnamed protein product [Rotaria socialis]